MNLNKYKLDFGLSSDVDNDYQVKEIQDMANIIQRMIKDGKNTNFQVLLFVF